VAAARLSKWLDGFADRHGPLSTEATPERVTVTAADGSVALIDVPFPPFDPNSPRTLTRLQQHVAADRRIGVLLVRRGGYAAGVFVGSKLVSSKVGSAYVQGTTKAGGWSQQRYARRRSNQASAAFAEAADVAARILLPECEWLDGIVCGGDRPAVRAVLADPRLVTIQALVTEPYLAVGDPKLKVLQATPEQFRVVQIAIHP
jgi:hypothetical protein